MSSGGVRVSRSRFLRVLLRSLLSSSAQGHQLPPFPLPSNDNVKVTELGNNLNFNSLGFVKIVHVAIYVHF